MERVVCIKEDEWLLARPLMAGEIIPTFREIYTVVGIDYDKGFIKSGKGYFLKEIPDSSWNILAFRPIDDTYGHAVCEMIEQKIALEEVNV
jgi:hypothetical protein